MLLTGCTAAAGPEVQASLSSAATVFVEFKKHCGANPRCNGTYHFSHWQTIAFIVMCCTVGPPSISAATAVNDHSGMHSWFKAAIAACLSKHTKKHQDSAQASSHCMAARHPCRHPWSSLQLQHARGPLLCHHSSHPSSPVTTELRTRSGL